MIIYLTEDEPKCIMVCRGIPVMDETKVILGKMLGLMQAVTASTTALEDHLLSSQAGTQLSQTQLTSLRSHAALEQREVFEAIAKLIVALPTT
jgi:hypothetical protein